LFFTRFIYTILNKPKKISRYVIKLPFKAMILICFIAPTAFAAPHHEAKAPADKGWLADLNGLPSREEIEKLAQHVDTIMQHEKLKTCTSINPRLRKMIFLHFALYQYMANKRSVYLDEKGVHHWAHVFGMLLKESSGDPTSVTSMTGRSYTSYESKSDLERWEKITKLSKNRAIPMNQQTNFGLTQLSVDRLFVALKLAQKPAILDGKKEADLNTAIAIRRLIWFYQDFAQGRLTQDHDRIHHHEQGNPEYSTRFTFGTSMALLLCGTHYMFQEGYHEKAGGAADLTEAMTSIAYCKLGNSKDGYGLNEANATCFAKWVTLCPTLNFDIAMLTPTKYFATRNAAPVCEGTFKALLIKKPVPHEKTSSTKKHHEPKQITRHPNKTLGSRVRGVLNTALTQLKNFLPKSTTKPNDRQKRN
jgi:hypothetical protein